MKFTDDKLASNLMNAITTGLYSRKLDCIREYLQNSYDAHATSVDIRIENGLHCVIEDNGYGMSISELEDAVGVGLYKKDPTKDEGVFGIGIWSGVAVSKKLIIITKKAGEPEKLKITIDSDYVINNSSGNIPLLTFLSNATSDIEKLPVSETEISKKFTIIRLEHLSDELRGNLFAPLSILNYVSNNLPVPMTKRWEYSEKITEQFDEQFMREMRVFVHDKGTVYEASRHAGLVDQTLEPEIKNFKVGERVVAKGWFAINKKFSTLSPELRGIQYKHNGFTIGSWEDMKGLAKTNFNEWWVGEIHICEKELKPTADRSTFQPVVWIDEFYDNIGSFIRSLQSINRSVSDNVTSPERQLNVLDKLDTPRGKEKLISDIENKNFKQSTDIRSRVSEFEKLDNVIKAKTRQTKEKLESEKVAIKKEKENTDPNRLQIKKTVEFIAPGTEGKAISTLLEKQHEDKMMIDYFITLKEKLEDKSGISFSSFSRASEVIGGRNDKGQEPVPSLLTLFKGAKDEDDYNKDVQKFFKSFNRIFRDYFQHAGRTPQTAWYEDLEDETKTKVKACITSTLALISHMIDRLEVKESDPYKYPHVDPDRSKT